MSYQEARDLTGQVQLQDGHSLPSACGGYADVYRGTCGGREVAVKVIRATGGKGMQNLQRKIEKEMSVWSAIEHQHVLPFLGFCRSIGETSPSREAWCFVSPWMTHGEARSYLENHPDVNRIQLGFGVAKGLYYLHLNGIVHGDIKGANVLINHLGTPMLCDFGLALFSESPATTTINGDIRGSVRWIAYELVMQAISSEEEDEPTLPTPQSDTWSFASTLLELLTLKLPYHSIRNDIQVLTVIMAKKLPFLPPSPGSTSSRRTLDYQESTPVQPEQSEVNYFAEVYKWPGVWNLCKDCWHPDPRRRPTMGTVVQRLGEINRKGPYDHQRRSPPHNPELYGSKRPPPEDEPIARKSPRLSGRELSDSDRTCGPLRILSSPSLDAAGYRSRSPQTPTMRTGGLHGSDEHGRKPRPSRLSFSTTSSEASTTGNPSNSSSGYSSARAHPYHTSAFRSNRPPHRRSPSSGSHNHSGGVVSSSAPPSLGPSRVPTIFPSSLNYSQETPASSSLAPSSSLPTVASEPSLNRNPLQVFPPGTQGLEHRPYDPRYTSGYTVSDTPYREAPSSGHQTLHTYQYTPHRQSTFPVEPLSHVSPPSSHHMTSQLFPSYPHHPSGLSTTRQSSSASSLTDSLPRSPSPAYPGSEPAVRMADSEYIRIGNHHNPYPDPCPQPLTHNPEDITPEQYALLEQQFISYSQGASPDHSPIRAHTAHTDANANGSNHPSQPMRKPPHRKVSETVQIRTEFLDKYKTLDDLLNHSPSPTDSTADWKESFPPKRSGGHIEDHRAPGKKAPAAGVANTFAAYSDLGRSTSSLGSPISFPASSVPPSLQYATEWTESPGMRGRSIGPDTPSLRPGLTLRTPLPTTSELFDEEAVVIEEDEEDEEILEPPDSYMSKVADDFDDETDVEPDEEDDDLFNSVIPLGFEDLSSHESFNEVSNLDNGTALFGGRIEDQYWRHEPHSNGVDHGAYPHSRDSTPTPRQHPIALPSSPKGLGIKISAT